MEDCRAAGRILLLDCCYSGAFAQGFKATSGGALEGQVGQGYVIMTAADEYEYAFEEDSMSLDSPRASIFTDVMLQALATGAADLDGDGWVAMDELFRYVHEAVVLRRPDQTPKFFAFSADPHLYIARAVSRNDEPGVTQAAAADASGEKQSTAPSSTLSRQHLAVARGILAIAEPIARTLGPLGRRVVVQDEDGVFLEAADAETVAAMFRAVDRRDELGVNYIRQLVTTMRRESGDGAATAVVLAQAMVRRAADALRDGASPVALKRGIEYAADKADAVVAAMARDVETLQELCALATTVSFDHAIGKVISEAFEKVGREGIISVVESQTPGAALKLTEGMLFQPGLISDYFVTDPIRMETVLEDPYILILNSKVSAIEDMLPLVDKVTSSGRPLAVIAEDVEGAALSLLVVNKIRGLFRSVAIRLPGTDEERRPLLEDIAILTGGQVISEDVGLNLENAGLDLLGRARRVVVTKQDTTIIDGAGEAEYIAGRVEQIRTELERADSVDRRELLRVRLCRLAGGIAEIKVGSMMETDTPELAKKVERTIRSTRMAVEEGWLPSAATAMLLARRELISMVNQNSQDMRGIAIVADSLPEPLLQIARNAGYSQPSLADLLSEPRTGQGVDVTTGKYVDLERAGMVDPVGVTRRAIAGAARIASRFVMVA
jgi:chaperonin GroEL